MSLILDALRGAKPSTGEPDPASAGDRPVGVDEVLTTLGYTRQPSRAGLPRWVPAIGLAALVFVVAWWGWREWRMLPEPTAETTAAAAEVVDAPPEPMVPEATSRPEPVSEEVPQVTAPAPPAATAPEPVSEPRVQTGGPDTTTASSRPSVSTGEAEPTVAAAPAAPDPPVRTEEPDHFGLALYHHRAGDYAIALQHYQALLDRGERVAEVHNNRGLVYREREQTQLAVESFRRAIELEPIYSKAHNNLGVTLLQTGEVGEALAEFDAAIDANAANVDAVVNLALAQRAAGFMDAARATLRRALALDPRSASCHFNLALDYEDSGEVALAIEHYRAFLKYGSSAHEQLAADVRQRIGALVGHVR